MLFGVVHGRFIAMLLRLGLVALGGMGMMSGLLVVARLMILGGMFVMHTRLLVGLSRLLVGLRS
jgi:hypothetical protein